MKKKICLLLKRLDCELALVSEVPRHKNMYNGDLTDILASYIIEGG